MHTVLTTATFDKQARRIGLSDDQVLDMCAFIAANPLAGDSIPGTGGCRKVRFAGRGKGKSGGYRTIHFFAAVDVPIFLLAVISKANQADLSQAERNELGKLSPILAAEYLKPSRT